MHPRSLRRTAVSIGLAAATLIAPLAGPAQARPDNGRPVAGSGTPVATGPVYAATDRLAQEVAATLADPDARQRIVSAVTDGPVDLLAANLGPRANRAARSANQTVLSAKGLPTTTGSVLQIRLGHQDMAAPARTAVPLVAAATTDDATTSVVGYDPAGGQVLLDVDQAPSRPVLVVEVDMTRAMVVGLELVRQELAAHGLARASSDVTAQAGYWATKVTAVRLNDDKEPYLKGAAEIFTVVGGFGHDGKARADIVQMPYLDHDGTVYYPNQLLVHFNNYKYNLADVVMWEDDGDTNYSSLAKALTSALLSIIDYGVYAPLVNAIIDAMPASWWTDDPDYVDSWYTLSTGSSGRLNGAAANGWLDVQPYWVQQF